MTHFTKSVFTLALLITGGQCSDIPNPLDHPITEDNLAELVRRFEFDPNLSKKILPIEPGIVGELAHRCKVAYPPFQDPVQRRNIYYHLSELSESGKLEKIVNELEGSVQDGRFKIALTILQEAYSKKKQEPFCLNQSSVSSPEDQQSKLIQACKNRLRSLLTDQELMEKNKNSRTIEMVMSVTREMEFPAGGITAVWDCVDLLRQEIMGKQNKEEITPVHQQTSVTVVSLEKPIEIVPEADVDMQEIAFEICLESLRNEACLTAEASRERIIQLQDTFGMDLKLIQSAFYRALGTRMQELEEGRRAIEAQKQELDVALDESSLRLECGQLLSENLTSDQLNDPDACDLAIAMIASANPHLSVDMLQSVLREIKTGDSGSNGVFDDTHGDVSRMELPDIYPSYVGESAAFSDPED